MSGGASYYTNYGTDYYTKDNEFGYCLFNGCKKIQKIVLPNSLTTIGQCAFWYCSNLQTLIIGSNVTTIKPGLWGGCSNLTDVTINNTNFHLTNGILYNKDYTTIIAALQTWNYGDLNIRSGVKEIQYEAFSFCSNLTSLTFPSTVTTIGDTAFGHTGISSVKFTSNITSIGSFAFSGNKNLKELDLTPLMLTTLNYGVFMTSNIETVYMPKSLNELKQSVFSLTPLKHIFVYTATPATMYDLASSSPTFEDVDVKNCVVHVPQGRVNTYKAAAGWKDFYYITDSQEMESDTEEAYAVYTTDGTLTFYYDKQKSSRNGTKYTLNTGFNLPGWSTFRKEIKKAVFDSSFSGATPSSTFFWFTEASNLTEIEGMQYLNTASVTSMWRMFDGCSSLTSLDLSHFNTEKVTNMMQMFNNCSSLTNLDLSNFNTENVTSMGGMFSRCSSLASLDLSNFNTANVIEITSMFWGCTSLITIYADETKWSTAKVASYNYEEGSGVFINCNNLIGGNGTVFDAYHTDYEYARIDKPGQPGYLTDKNAETDELCDADDLLRFIENLSGNTTTNDNPAEATLCDEPTIDQDVDIEDDLWLYLYGDDDITPPVMNFYGGAINLKSRNSGWTFKGVGFTCKNEATAPMRAAEGLGGITSVGTLTFDGCTMKEGNYTIQNLSDGRMYLTSGTVVEGYGNLINSGNVYIDGSVKVADLANKKGGRIYVTSTLTEDIKVSISSMAEVEQDVPIILGGNGYTMTAADVSHITLTLPDGYEWKYNETVGGIVVSTTSGIANINTALPVAVDSYDVNGHKVAAGHQGITIQRMSDGTVVKIYSPK